MGFVRATNGRDLSAIFDAERISGCNLPTTSGFAVMEELSPMQERLSRNWRIFAFDLQWFQWNFFRTLHFVEY
jgi:hypothetical protein